MARGDLVEVTPASYGVISRAFHFWSGEGRGDPSGQNLYENFAEATSGKGSVLPDSGVNFAVDAMNMEREAEEEEGRDKEERKEERKRKLRLRRVARGVSAGTSRDRRTSAGLLERHPEEDGSGGEEVLDDEQGVEQGGLRDERASEYYSFCGL
jgi:6-phosphofructo-2-kinase/fructose-2,6-biphosphatase 4